MISKITTYLKSHNLYSLMFIIGISLYALISISSQYRSIITESHRVTDENIFSGLTPKIVVRSVVPDGASDRAGMKVNDTIVAINSQTFRNAQHADKILRAAEPGSIMKYDILRGQEKLTLNVQAATQKLLLRHIVGFIVGLIFTLIGLYFAYSKHYIFSAKMLSASLILLSPLASLIIVSVNPNYFFLIQIILAVFIGFPLIFHLVYHIPYFQEKRYKQIQKYISFYYYLNIITALLFIIDLHVTKNLRLSIFNFSHLNAIGVIKTCLFIILLLLFFALAFYHLFKALPKNAKSQKYIRFAWALSIFGVILGRYFSFVNVQPAGEIFYLLVAFIPLSYVYIVSKENTFGAFHLVKRSYRYLSIYSSVLTLSILLFFYLLNQLSIIDLQNIYIRINTASIEVRSTPAEGFGERPFFILMGILLFITYWLSFLKLKKLLDKRFSKTAHNYKEVLSSLSKILATSTQSEDVLFNNITRFVKESVRLKGVALFINDCSKFEYKSNGGFGEFIENELQNTNIHYQKDITIQLVIANFKEECKPEFKQLTPLIIDSETIGFILLGEKESEEVYNNDDFELLNSIANQIAIVLEHIRLSQESIKSEFIKRDIELAKSIQLGLLPQENPSISGLDIYGYYQAAKDVGGDYYDYLIHPSNNSISVVVGDVSGKGISASLYMSRFQGIMRSLFYNNTKSPKSILEKLNISIYNDIDRNAFVTCILSEFDTASKTFRCSRAGHSPMLHYRSSKKEFLPINSSGIGLGLTTSKLFDKNLEMYSDKYIKDDIFILYTDGISEAMNKQRQEFGDDRLMKIIEQNHQLSSEKLCSKIIEEIENFVGDQLPHDDITLTIIKIQ